MDYFFKMYMMEKEVDEQTWGVSKAWFAVWWCGAQSSVKPGFGPSQQVAEMWNSKAKLDLRRMGDLKTHQAVVVALERCLQSWSRPLKPGEENSKEAKYSLMSPNECLSASKPTCPDSWMVTSRTTTRRRVARKHFSSRRKSECELSVKCAV